MADTKVKPKKGQKRERLTFRLPTETASTLRQIAKLADVTVDQVVTVILATRIVTERGGSTAVRS